ncbi:unnamed protein product, partial [Laminaria digitata]
MESVKPGQAASMFLPACIPYEFIACVSREDSFPFSQLGMETGRVVEALGSTNCRLCAAGERVTRCCTSAPVPMFAFRLTLPGRFLPDLHCTEKRAATQGAEISKSLKALALHAFRVGRPTTPPLSRFLCNRFCNSRPPPPAVARSASNRYPVGTTDTNALPPTNAVQGIVENTL